jgi:hypothetical protein
MTIAGIKKRQDEYNASRNSTPAAAPQAQNTMAKVGDFNF